MYDRVELLELQYKVRFAEHASIENSAKMHEYLKHSNSRVEQRSQGDGGGAFLNLKLPTSLFPQLCL